MKDVKKMMGSWAFLVGVILAVVLGAVSSINGLVAAIFVVIGIAIGLLNITAKETKQFLMAGAILVIVAALGQTVMGIIPAFGRMMSGMLIIFVPATIIVALKSVFLLAKE